MNNAIQFTSEGYLREDYHYFHLRDTAGQERDFHFHEFDKIVILLSGRVDYTVESDTYELKPWDILLVGHHMIHRAVIDQSEPYDRVIIYLDGKFADRIMPEARLMSCFTNADKRARRLLRPGDGDLAAFEGLLLALEATLSDTQFGAQAMRDTLILQLLIRLNRLALSGGQSGLREGNYDAKIAQTLSYINEDPSRELSVDTLSERAFMSKYHFMRLFKAQTGYPVHEYVRQKRLMYAARLIREGVPAAKAAADSGFGDYSAFHRAFTESFGISPGKLRTQRKG